jgi:excisionase family DNA binding protein
VLTVSEAARRAGCNPESVRRWIRSGKLRATKVGTQHFVEEGDLQAVLDENDDMLPLPREWDVSPRINWVRSLRQTRGAY